VPPAAIVRSGRRLYAVEGRGAPVELGPLAPDAAEVAAWLAEPDRAELPSGVRAKLPAGAVSADDPAVARGLSAAGRTVAPVALPEWRWARERAPAADVGELRAIGLAFGQRALRRALADPGEVVITLAREEARVERALGRDRSATDELTAGGSGPTDRYLASARSLRTAHEHHLDLLRGELEAAARAVAPNLAALVGPITAARLVAEAGGLRALARMSGSRIQLLGARRRPSPVRGPRYGLIVRATRLNELPPDRWAAFARSLAALAAIASRADAITGGSIAGLLVARRDRRFAELARR